MTPLMALSGTMMMLIVVAFFLIFTTLAQRPLKKQAEEQAAMRKNLGEGTRVLLTGGLFGTVTHVGDEQIIVELAPGVEVTATKQAVSKVVAPEDEEFEFTDEADDAADVASYDVPDDASSLVAEEELTFDPTPEADTDEPEARPEDKN